MRDAVVKGWLVALVLLAGIVATEAAPRSHAARDAFMKQTGHPHGWPGHVVDHIVPLCAGGPDTPENMQWQTVEAAKEKDRYEKHLCAAMKREGLHMGKSTW
jgi:hypothetical protein